ncbi:MAG: hypothetical protein KDA44_23860 [Planctomycetales bacterium]|nr:hypothetical protein [Planctomycetales bacterium]
MFSDLEPDLPASGGDDYRRLSSLAVVAFVLGLLSVTAFISPYFFIFPVAAIGACLAAFNAVQRSDGTLTGKRLAAAGLALAVALTAAAQTRVVVRDRIYRREAAAAAAQWLDLLGKQQYSEALKMLSPRAVTRVIPTAPRGADPPSPEETLAYSIDKLKNESVSEAAATGANGTWRWAEDVIPPYAERGSVKIGGNFSSSDSAAPLVFLQLARSPAFERDGVPWRIDHWKVLE